jgi:hypothetical protein
MKQQQQQQRLIGGQENNKRQFMLLLKLDTIPLAHLFPIGAVIYFLTVVLNYILLPSVDNNGIIQLLRNREKGEDVAISLSHERAKKQNFFDGIFVISLQGVANSDAHNKGRLDSFKEAWRKSCGSLDPGIRVCPGVVDERRGYGLTRSWLDCLQMARDMNFGVTMIFEDDARLFDNESALDFCDVGKRQSKVWGNLPEDTFIAFLGGHTWTYDHEPDSSRFRQAYFSYGTYGFAVPRQSLDVLLETFKGDIAHGFVDENGVRQTEFLSPEKSFYGKARDVGKKVYAINPLAVWHQGGFSNTWKVDRESITGDEEDDDGDYDVGGIRGVSAR